MSEILIFSIIGLSIGLIIGWALCKMKYSKSSISDDDLNKIIELEKELSTSQANLITTKEVLEEQSVTISNEQDRILELNNNITELRVENDFSKKKLVEIEDKLSIKENECKDSNENLGETRINLANKEAENSALKLEIETLKTNNTEKDRELNEFKNENKEINNSLNSLNKKLALSQAENESLNEKLQTQKKEIEEIGEKFKLEFENIASKILETNSEKISEVNKINIKSILDPLSLNIEQFKTKINETYDKESKERFSLGEKVKELSELNKKISEEAKNLTQALKGESKTQGLWGEMILESILEKSGLRKDEEYFIEYQLEDADGKPLKSDIENKKMRPDVVIKYPDNRCIIIDSKVSLNSFVRYTSTDDVVEQESELKSHVTAVKNHIISLSKKGYDDYDKSLDFVMMFIPSEPAYMAALKGDPELWNFAYDKRILLINPTNLIISLKLIVDLWKREYQNKNAQDIADRGAKLYDKFVGFLDNFTNIEKHLNKSKEAYNDAFKQLSSGRDNLISQTTKLKKLGVKNKKSMPVSFAQEEDNNILIEQN